MRQVFYPRLVNLVYFGVESFSENDQNKLSDNFCLTKTLSVSPLSPPIIESASSHEFDKLNFV